MIEPRTLSRREALILLGGATITITAACGGGSSPSGSSGSGGSGDKSAQISANHGHSLVIRSAQLSAGGALTLETSGADHVHSIALTGAEVTSIAGGAQVSKSSSTANGHSHTITFN